MAKEKQTRLLVVLGVVLAVLAALGWVLTAVPAMTQDNSGERDAGITAVAGIIPDGSFEDMPSLWIEGDLTNPRCSPAPSAIGDWSALSGFPAFDGVQTFLAGSYCDNGQSGGQSPVRSNYVEQRLSVPPDVSGLSFWFAAHSDSAVPTGEDTAYIEFRDPVNQTVLPGKTIMLDGTVLDKGWLHGSVDISPFAGQDVIVRFGVFNTDPVYASSVLFDFIEWGEAPATSVPVDPANGGQLDYYGPLGLTTQVIVPGGAVSQTTSIWYRPAGSPGFPLNSVVPLGGTALTYAGIAFDLDAFDEFVYLPLITKSSSGQGNAQSVFGLNAASPQAPAETTRFFFNTPISITIYYDETRLNGIPEDQLYLYYWDPAAQMWQDVADSCNPALSYVRDVDNNFFTVQVCHFSRMSVVGI
ncbi:MAG: hypothetical protein HF973_18195 [Chloroflexi bacterium]|nr:hypothetical protein [Chloroflexota bacterium]